MSVVTLVGVTKPTLPGVDTVEDLVAYAARVSNPTNQANSETAPRLLRYLMKNQHWSPFEMVSMTMEITTTRDIARQILRHRSFAFQEFCVAEGTLITCLVKSGKSEKVPIENLYKRYIAPQYWNMSDNLVRVYDQTSKTLMPAKIKEVFKTGIKEVYELVLDNGKTIQSTKEHKFLTRTGFLSLGDITTDMFVATNGIPVYQDREWLIAAKAEAIATKTGLQGIADLAEITTHTIRKWLKIHSLQFTRHEIAKYTTVWNKGLAPELQPMYGKSHSLDTRALQRQSARKGENSNLYSSGEYSFNTISWRAKVAQQSRGSITTLLQLQAYTCATCTNNITADNSEVDHVLPVYSNPELAFKETNLQALCKECHTNKSAQETLDSKYTVKYSKVVSITLVGLKETYDMEIEHTDHNYVANGIITHNSQRYASAESLGFETREARMQDPKNRQASLETTDLELQDMWQEKQHELLRKTREVYAWALSNGIAKEQARAVLPEGNTQSRLYMAGTLRSWLHYCILRTELGTQKEHRIVAEQCFDIVKLEFPSIAELFINKD